MYCFSFSSSTDIYTLNLEQTLKKAIPIKSSCELVLFSDAKIAQGNNTVALGHARYHGIETRITLLKNDTPVGLTYGNAFTTFLFCDLCRRIWNIFDCILLYIL